jgi:TetR/AcrR family transcriptional regulator of autoinduction and epiphytic fitness
MADVKMPAPEGRRQKRARQTRRSILAAAHELFVRQGYTRTTIQQIADQADVAWQTVYAVFGGKPAILSAVFDVAVVGDDEPVPVPERPFVHAIAEAGDPLVKARIFARHLREAGERIAGVLSVIESAAATDPEIADLWRELQDQRLRGMTMAVRSFQQQGALRPGLSAERAADRGWSLDEYEAWLGDTLYAQVMNPGAAGPPSP